MVPTAQIALIFPGQGSQFPGMGRELAETRAEARAVFDEADRIAGRSISGLCFEGSEDELRRTSNTQPALFVASAAALAVLRAGGIDGAMTAGHSLGEYTALYAAGALDFQTALGLVEVRGRAMERTGRNRPGAMAALLGSEDAPIEELCNEASTAGIVVPANWNSPGQVVVSGEEAGVDRAVEIAKDFKIKRAVKLNVGGAFHSPLMIEAADELGGMLAQAEIRPPRLKFVANVNARFLDDAESIRSSLADQLTQCVMWSDCVRTLADAGATHFVEVGPGNVLTGLLKRIDRALIGLTFASPGDVPKVKSALSG
jgi:[acyl-carrier-protein] S-malonyltransferase